MVAASSERCYCVAMTKPSKVRAAGVAVVTSLILASGATAPTPADAGVDRAWQRCVFKANKWWKLPRYKVVDTRQNWDHPICAKPGRYHDQRPAGYHLVSWRWVWP